MNHNQVSLNSKNKNQKEIFSYLPMIDNSKDFTNRHKPAIGYKREKGGGYHKGPQNRIWFMNQPKRVFMSKGQKDHSGMKITFNK